MRAIQARHESATQLLEEAALWSRSGATATTVAATTMASSAATAADEAILGTPDMPTVVAADGGIDGDVAGPGISMTKQRKNTTAGTAEEERETYVSSGVERRARARSSNKRHAAAKSNALATNLDSKPSFNAAAAAAAIAAAAARGDSASLFGAKGGRGGGVDAELARMARYGARRQLEEVVSRWRSIEPMLAAAAAGAHVVEVCGRVSGCELA